MSLTEQRWDRILSVAAERQKVTVNDLALELDVSRETIRRDLSQLDERGLLQKVHGGAVHVHSASEGAFRKRQGQNAKEKNTIAQLVNELLKPGESVMMNAGTTVYAVANAIASRDDLTVITNSLDIASRLLHGHGGNSVVLLGGNLGRDSQTYGEMTMEEIRRFRVDHAVLTIGAMDTTSIFFDFSIEIASVARAMMQQARQITIVADNQKLGRTALVELCKIKDLSRVVTDAPPSAEMSRAFTEAKVDVIFPDAS